MRKGMVLTAALLTVAIGAGLLAVAESAGGAVNGVLEDAKKKDDKAPATGDRKGDGKDDGKGGDCYQFVAPLEAVMEVMDEVFQRMLDKAKAGKFKELKRESLFVAEIANLATHVKEFRGKTEYIAFADTMKSTALQMAEAAQKKDEAAIKTLHDKVEQTCDSCHEKFRDN